MAIYMWREYIPKTFTISWEEKTDMSSGWTYSDDAAGLTAGDSAFDDFFGYSAVLLNTSGVETAEMKQSGGVFTGAMSTLGNITSGDNVMIKFPVRGIKMSKSGSIVTLSITEELNKSGYQYYAFNANGTRKDNLYLGAYKGTKSGNYLKSWSGASSIGSFSLNTAVAAANAYGGGYHEETWYARQYINALYMMKYGNPNSQNVVGRGFVNSSGYATTGGTNSQTNATYGTTSSTVQCKLFGLEDRWGNISEWLDGAYGYSDTTIQTSTTQAFSTSSRITSFDRYVSAVSGMMKSIDGTNNGMFASNERANRLTEYYGDVFYVGSSQCFLAGGGNTRGDEAGVFFMELTYPGNVYARCGTRLMYL